MDAAKWTDLGDRNIKLIFLLEKQAERVGTSDASSRRNHPTRSDSRLSAANRARMERVQSN